MKKVFFIGVILILYSCGSNKLVSYNDKFKKVPTQAELVTLNISEFKPETQNTSTILSIKRLEDAKILNTLIDQIPKIPQYVGKIIKNSKKKYNQSYKARNTIAYEIINSKDSTVILPKLELERRIFIQGLKKDTTAIKISLTPQYLDNGLFVFKLEEIKMNYSKAKIKAKYPFVNVSVSIKGIYIQEKDNKLEEVEVDTKEIIFPIKHGESILSEMKINLFSDPLKIKNLRAIEVSVGETNPFFVKLEELEDNLDENKDLLDDLLKTITEKLKE